MNQTDRPPVRMASPPHFLRILREHHDAEQAVLAESQPSIESQVDALFPIDCALCGEPIASQRDACVGRRGTSPTAQVIHVQCVVRDIQTTLTNVLKYGERFLKATGR